MIQPDANRVFLANLNFEADEDDVRELAGHHGEVHDVYFPKDYGTDKHRGMCFIGAASADDAAAIVTALEGVTHLGRRLRWRRVLWPHPAPLKRKRLWNGQSLIKPTSFQAGAMW